MWLQLLKSCIEDDFGEELKTTISKLGMSVREFSKECDIPESTLYKIISEKKNFGIATLKKIVKTVKRLEGYTEENVIGIITKREALDYIGRELEIGGKKIVIKEYPATTIEEEIIQGIRAEREGVKGLICGPIAATTLEKIISIPIVTIRFEEGPLMNSIQKLIKKLD